MSITSIIAFFLIAVAVIFGFSAWRDYRKAGNQWNISARVRRRTAFIFGLIGLALLLLANLS